MPAASNYVTGGATKTANDDLAQYASVERAIVQFFRTDASGPDGHHVRQILDGAKKIAPESLSGDKTQQLQLIAYAFSFFFFFSFLFWSCESWGVGG